MTRDLQSVVKEDIVVYSIRQQLRHPLGEKRIWVVVEGIDDQKLFSKLINGSHVKFEFDPTGFGKTRLLKVVAELLKETNQVIGIRDADFLHLEGQTETPEHIFLTDYHDAEMMMIACDKAYQQVAAEYLGEHVDDPFVLRETILQRIAFVGGLKWLNTNGSDVESESLGFNFKNLGLKDYYTPKTFQFDEEKYLHVIMKRSQEAKSLISAATVRDKIKDVADFYNLGNGKDFQDIFALHIGISNTVISNSFRIAYRYEDFQHTHLYQSLTVWSQQQAKPLFKSH